MNIPLPPSPSGDSSSRPDRSEDEYSPSQITSPQSDDEEMASKSGKDFSPQHYSSSGGSISFGLNSSKKVLTKKKASNILKSFKMSSTSLIVKKPTRAEEEAMESGSQEDDQDLRSSIAKAEIRKEKLKEREREREKDQKLNIESLMEEETKEKTLIPKLDMMPNKAGSSFQRTMNAVGPIAIDELHRIRAEEKAKTLAANLASAAKGPVMCDSFGFVTARRPEQPKPESSSSKDRKSSSSKRDSHRRRSKSRDRGSASERDRKRDRSRDRNDRDRNRDRDRERDRDRDRDKDRDRKDKSAEKSEKSEKSSNNSSDKKRDDKHEAVKKQYGLKEMPNSWKVLTSNKIDPSGADYARLKRAFNVKDAEMMEKMVLVYSSDRDTKRIPDPMAAECESGSKHYGRSDYVFEKHYLKVEFPGKKIKKTKTTPSIEWSTNPRTSAVTALYKGRKDQNSETLGMIDTLLNSSENKSVDPNDKEMPSVQLWYTKSSDFMKPRKTEKKKKGKRKPVKKSTDSKKDKRVEKPDPIENEEEAALDFETEENMDAEELINLLKKDIKSSKGKKDKKKKKKKKKAEEAEDVEENMENIEQTELDEGEEKPKKKKKKKVNKEKKAEKKAKKKAKKAKNQDLEQEEQEEKAEFDEQEEEEEQQEADPVAEALENPLNSQLMKIAGYSGDNEVVQESSAGRSSGIGRGRGRDLRDHLREREHHRDRDRDRDRDQDSHRDRERERDRDIDGPRNRERERSRDLDGHRDRDRDRDPESLRDRERNRDPEVHRDRERERDRDREPEVHRDGERDRDRDFDAHRDRDHDFRERDQYDHDHHSSHRKRKREDPRSPSPLPPHPGSTPSSSLKKAKRPRTPPVERSVSPPTDPRLRSRHHTPSAGGQGPRTPSPRGRSGPRTPPSGSVPIHGHLRSRSRSPVYSKGRHLGRPSSRRSPSPPPRSGRGGSPRSGRGGSPRSGRSYRSPSPGRYHHNYPPPPHSLSPHYRRSRYGPPSPASFRLERSVADSTINDADLMQHSSALSRTSSGAPLPLHDDLFHSSAIAGAIPRTNSPKRPSLDERLEKELGIKVAERPNSGLPPTDFSKPPPGYPPILNKTMPTQLPPIPSMVTQPPESPKPEDQPNQRLVRVGNMLQIVPESVLKEKPLAKASSPAATPANIPKIVPVPLQHLQQQPPMASEQPQKMTSEIPPNRLNEEDSVKNELLRKLEEQKRRKEAERRQRREQRLKKLEEPETQQQPETQQLSASGGSSGGKRILEELDKEEARILAEAMTSVPEDPSVSEEAFEEPLEDIQGLSEAERRSKSRRKDADVRYISLKPFFKKERKRPKASNEEYMEAESNGNQDDLDNYDDDEDFVKPSPVPLPDASTCRSILHRFGYNSKAQHKKSLRYADGVLPGQGSPDHHSSVSSQEVSPTATPVPSNR